MKKFELTSDFITNEYGFKLFRIRALVDLRSVKAGDLGGYVEKEGNLSHGGTAWIYDDACVYGDACVCDNAKVSAKAHVRDCAKISGNACVYGDACVYGKAKVFDYAKVCGDAKVFDYAKVCGNAWVYNDANVYGSADVSGFAKVCGDADVCGDARIYDKADLVYAHGFGSEYRTTTFFRLKDGDVGVSCGCFYGTLQEFRDKVRETHGKTKKAREYLMLADLMELRFKEENKDGKNN